MTGNDILLVYDKDCPLCDNYCRLLRIRNTIGNLVLVDARVPSSIMDEITARGLDIDQGMVLKIGSQLYYGADAIHALALISSQSGLFNRGNYWLFRSRFLSSVLYPCLRACRNLLLKLMNKNRINNLQIAGNEKF